MENIINDLGFEDYRALDAINWSSLKRYDRSPAHYREALLQPMSQTPAMLVGSAVHTLVLEGEAVYQERYAVAPEGIDRRTKAGKEAWAQFEQDSSGKDVLTADQNATICGMGAAVLAHPRAGKLLSLCMRKELSLTWNDFETGLKCKARPDGWAESEGLVIDLKTTDDASFSAFSRTVAKYQYHGQAAFYLDGLRAAGGRAEQFLFIVVEKTAPYGVAVFLADDEMLAAGRQRAAGYLSEHAECLAIGSWPGYPVEVQTLSLPPWA